MAAYRRVYDQISSGTLLANEYGLPVPFLNNSYVLIVQQRDITIKKTFRL